MNNYDQSSTGENIQFTAHYSCDLASIYYDEFTAEALRLDFGRDSALFLLGDCEKPFFTESQLNKKTKNQLFDLCLDYELLGWQVNLKDYKKADYIDDLLDITIRRHYEFLTANFGWHELGNAIPHSFYVSRGYSQGDAVYIVALDDDLTKEKRQHIDRVLWDSPVSIYCTVNDQEFFEDSFLTDEYEWDRDKVADKVKALPISESAKAWIIEALPEYPDYQ